MGGDVEEGRSVDWLEIAEISKKGNKGCQKFYIDVCRLPVD
jgi:hypothetical protein